MSCRGHEGRENVNEVEQTSRDPSPNLDKETEIRCMDVNGHIGSKATKFTLGYIMTEPSD